ncbi:tetratricopeptide repeat protein [Flavobacterium sp.]|uniref:tetratricopeptide repeat protein n=1 Tax=Flavobacterium sp. TaxID=239 RepID=UPI0035294571
MKNSFFFIFFLTQLLAAQTEEEWIQQNNTVLKKAEALLLQDNITVEKSIVEINQLIQNQSSVYVQHALMIYRANQEKRLNVKTATATMQKVVAYLNKHTNYVQLRTFYNRTYGRILFEMQKDCKGALTLYEENLALFKTIKQPYAGWNVVMETQTGVINSLLCLERDQEALEYLKQFESEINPETQLKEYVYVLGVSGYIHTKFANYNEGEKYFLKVIALLENRTEHQDNYLASCNNLAHIYKVTEQTDKGIALLEKALKRAKKIKELNNEMLIANNLGFLYVKKEMYQKAQQLGLAVLQTADEKQFGFHTANANRLLATVHYHLGNYQTAEQYIEKAIAYYRNFQNQDLLRQALDVKNKVLIQTQHFEEAAKVNAEIISMLDSISLRSNVQNLQRSLVAYETEKKDQEITILKQKDKIQAFEIEKQKQFLRYSLIGLAVLFTVAFLIVYYQRKINAIQSLALRSKLTRSQFNPHYINNAFTALQATLIEQGMDENLINYTADISRFSRLLLESTFKDEWTLFEEKQMIINYLKTQAHRFNDAFAFHLEDQFTEHELNRYQLPSALTQTVLENAIEHSGFQQDKPGTIEVFFEKNQQKELVIKVINTIVGEDHNGFKKHDNAPSRGLEITKQRLELHRKIHRQPTSFSFDKKDAKVCVTFTLPLLAA